MRAARPLTNRTLAHHAQRVRVPTYDRRSLAPSVVHMSVGSFHRSHQAVYFDEIAQRALSLDWGVVGLGLHRPEMHEVLHAQDGLYTVVTRGAEGSSARIVGAMVDYHFARARPADVIAAFADPRTRLVTLTITRAAYAVDPGTGLFVSEAPGLQADLADPRRPNTALGYLVEGLDRRRRARLPGLTVLSCDNIAANGAITRTAVVEYARSRDAGLAAWIEDAVSFPSSMVDRITPQTTVADRGWVAAEFGVADRWPVITEPFSQWIIEDDFAAGRPPLAEVGAQLVGDVTPYALMKTRLLNGSHCAIGYLGYLAGHRRIDAAVEDPVFAAYVQRLMKHEVAPLLPPVPGIDLPEYRRALLTRFANGAIADRLARLCRNGSAKMPTHVLPSLIEARAAGRPHALLLLAVAGWMRYLRAVDEEGTAIVVDDPRADRLRRLARAGGDDPRPLLSDRRVFGSLAGDEVLVAGLQEALAAFSSIGTRAAVARALGRDLSAVA